MESRSYVLSFRMVFFYLVTTGWIFDISSCENLKKNINQLAVLSSSTAAPVAAYEKIENQGSAASI